MKQLLFLGTIAAFAVGTASAQNIDIQAVTTIEANTKMCATKFLTPSTDQADSVHGVYGLRYDQGPETAIEGDKLTFRSSFHKFLTEQEAIEQNVPFEDRYAWYGTYTLTQQNVDNGMFMFSYDSIGDMGMLLDWERYEEYGLDSLTVYGPPHEQFENGKAYGFFVRTWGMGEDANNIVNVDPDMSNNWAVVKIIWNECDGGISVNDLIAPKKTINLSVYPNPVSDNINFTHNFEKNTNARVNVTDLSGRTVLSQNLGHIKAGERNFSLDVSKLSAGMYTIELSAGEFSATSKFTVQR
jgi:hypothetical protein